MSKRIFAILVATMAFLCVFAAFSLQPAPPADALTYLYINSETDWETFITGSKQNVNGYCYQNTVVELNTDLYFYRRNDDPDYKDTQNYVRFTFSGIFEGNGHSLVGLRYNSSTESRALFSSVGKSGVVQNLNLVDIAVTSGVGAGGVVFGNSGEISNVRVQGSLSAPNAGGIACINSGKIIDCVSAVDNNGSVNFGAAVYENFFYTLEGIDYFGTVENTYNVTGEPYLVSDNAAGAEIPLDTLLDDGFADDFFELLYLKYNLVTVLAGIEMRHPGLYVGMRHDINLYNQEADWLDTALAEYPWTGNYHFYNYNGTSFAPNLSAYTLPIERSSFVGNLLLSGTGAEGDPYIYFVGSGAERNPYIISTPEDLQRLDYLYAHRADWSLFDLEEEDTLWFLMTEDISLLDPSIAYYDINIENFDGVFDGGGKSVAGVINSLFDTVAEDGTVKNLYLRGEVRADGEAVLAKENYGLIAGVTATVSFNTETDDRAAGLVCFNHDRVIGCSVRVVSAGDGDIAAAVYENAADYGFVIGTRSASQGLPFIFTGDENAMAGCYNDNAVWCASDTDMFPYQSVAEYSGTQHFRPDTDPYDLLDTANPQSGWGWEDANVYGYDWCVLAGSTDDRFALRFSSDITTYKSTGRLRFNNQEYELSFVVEYAPEGHAFDVESFVNAENIPPYTWTFTNNIETVRHTDNFPNPLLGEVITDIGVYDIYFSTLPTDTVTTLKGHASIEIKKIQVTYTKADLRVLSEENYKLFAGINQNYGVEAFYTQNIEGVTYQYVAEGVYINGVLYPFSGTLTNKIYDSVSIPSNNAAVFLPFCAPADATVTYEIIKYYKPGEQTFSVKPAFIQSAGTYYLTITIHHAHYFDAIISDVIYKITPYDIPVTPYISYSGGKLPYGVAAAGYVGYTIDTSGLGDQLTLAALAEVGYTTAYTAGSAVGMYNLASTNLRNISVNYRAVPVTVQFEVVKINIPGLSSVTFANEGYLYNGLWKTVEAAGLSGSMAVKYTYNSVVTESSPQFIDVGAYTVSALVYIKNPDGSKNTNYIDAPALSATLTVNPKTITVTVDSYTILSGESLPSFSVLDFSSQLPQRADSGTDSFTAPQFGLNPSYSGAAGNYSIGLTGGLVNANYHVNVNTGTLTVNRVSRRSFALVNNVKTYDGLFYQPDFGTATDYNAAGISYYRLDGEVWTMLVNAPKNAGSYKISVPFIQTARYIAETLESTFHIDKAALSLQFTHNGVLNRLATSITVSAAVYDELIYNGQTYTVALSGLPAYESFLITLRYDKGGVTEETTSGMISYAEAGYYSNFRAVVSGNTNYEPLALYGGDIEYKQRTLRATIVDHGTGLSSAVYGVRDITLDISVSNPDNVLVQDRAYILISYTSSPSVIRNAGEYALSISTGNPNYVFISQSQDGRYTFTVGKCTATVNMADNKFETVYGSASSTFLRTTTYLIGQMQNSESLTYNVSLPIIVTAGAYTVTGISSTTNVDFILYGGTDAYIVKKRTVSFVWALQSQYEYSGTTRTDISNYTVPNNSITGRQGNDYVGVSVVFDKSVIRDCGSYTATARISSQNYALDPACVSFSFSIIGVQLTLRADDITIDYGDAAPAYTATFQGLRGEDTTEAAAYSFECAYRQGDNANTYIIYVTSFSLGNYIVDLSDASGVLTVAPIEQTGIVYRDTEAVYNGLPYTYLPQVPAGAVASVDIHPQDAGVYTLTAVVTRANYLPKTLTAAFTVRPASPSVTLNPVSVFLTNDNQKISSVSITGSADYGGTPIPGGFSYVNPDEALTLGEHGHVVVFTPDNGNFAAVSSINIVTAVIENADTFADILTNAGAEERDGTLYTVGDDITLLLSVPRELKGNVQMFINGELAENGMFTVTASGTVTVDIKKDGILISSYQYNVLLNTEIPEDEPAEEPVIDDNNGGGGTPIVISPKKEIDWMLFLYITLGIAAAAGLGFGLYFIIRMRH